MNMHPGRRGTIGLLG